MKKRETLKLSQKQNAETFGIVEPKRNEAAMRIARDQVEDINWKLMTKKIQVVVENRIVDGLKRENDKSIDMTNKLGNLIASLRSRSQGVK